MSNIIQAAVQCRLVWTRSGQDHAVNVMHYAWPPAGTVDAAAVGTFSNAFIAAMGTSGILPFLSNTISLARIGLRDRRSANQPLIEDVIEGGVAGSSVEVELPPDVACVCTLRTPLAGRGFRGRIYFCGWAENANGAGGLMAPAVQTAVEAFVASVQHITLPAGVADLAVAHQFNAGLPLEPGGLQVVTSAVVRDQVWDRQKRRAQPGI